MKDNQEDYYNRESLETSYKIAVLALMALIVGGLLMTAWGALSLPNS